MNKNWAWRIDLLRVLLRKELTVRYKGSVLGFFWSILNPLAMALVYFIVFQLYMRFNIKNYIVVLLSGLFPWQCFMNCVGEGPFCFLANPTLVKKVAFPRQAIPLVMNLQHLVHFLISLPVFLLFLLGYGLYPDWNWLWGVPLFSLIMITLIYGLCLFFGTINIFFKDIGNLVSIILNLAFFGTPIFYTLESVPQKFLWCFMLNPIAPIMICWRSLLIENRINLEYLPIAIGYSLFALLLGGSVFIKLQHRFAEVM